MAIIPWYSTVLHHYTLMVLHFDDKISRHKHAPFLAAVLLKHHTLITTQIYTTVSARTEQLLVVLLPGTVRVQQYSTVEDDEK